MVNRSIAAVLGVCFCIGIFFIGCKKGCPTCRTYGYIAALGANVYEVCTNSACYCPNGLEGDSCQTLSLTKYFQPSATWQATDGCSGSTAPYYVYMTYNLGSSAFNNVFYINGLFGSGTQVEADIISNASHQGITLNIPAQSTQYGTINSGTGIYQTNGATGKITINLDFYSNNTGLDVPCQVILYQQ